MSEKLAKKRRRGRVSRGDTLFWAGKRNARWFSRVSFVRSSMSERRERKKEEARRDVDDAKENGKEKAIYLLFCGSTSRATRSRART